MSLERSITISNDATNLSKVRQVVSEILDHTSFNREMRNKIIVAVDEALANVVEHAYQGGQGDICIKFDLDARTFRVNIRDKGVRFDPGDRINSAVDIHHHIKLGLKGGLGLFLMRKIMDEVQFNHDGADFVNELVMIKLLPGPPTEGAQPAGGAQSKGG